MTTAPNTPDHLKAELTDQLRWLCAMFGQPRELLRLLTVAEWRRLRIWVRGVEALAARLVRALASTIEAATTTAAPQTAPRSTRAVRIEPTAPDTDYPESDRWIGVRFRFAEHETQAAPSRTAATSGQGGFQGNPQRGFLPQQADAPRGFRSARRLALRLEAVIRVAENAQRYAKRLARRMARPRRQNPRRIAPQAPRVARIAALGPPIRPPVIETG